MSNEWTYSQLLRARLAHYHCSSIFKMGAEMLCTTNWNVDWVLGIYDAIFQITGGEVKDFFFKEDDFHWSPWKHISYTLEIWLPHDPKRQSPKKHAWNSRLGLNGMRSTWTKSCGSWCTRQPNFAPLKTKAGRFQPQPCNTNIIQG